MSPMTVTGWRAWKIMAPNTLYPRLRSITAQDFGIDVQDTIWPPERWFHAVCKEGHSAEQIPVQSCDCGIYAAADCAELLGYEYGRIDKTGIPAIGEVTLAGRIIPSNQGWKAQRAQVQKLYLPFSQAEVAVRLSAIYNVEHELVDWWAANPDLLNIHG